MTKALLLSLDEQFSVGLHQLPDATAILKRMLNYGDVKRLHRAHINLWGRLFSIKLALTMRQGVERMLSVGDHFGDEAIGADEIREFFAEPQDLEDENGIRHPESQVWLSALGLPKQAQLIASQEAYHSVLEHIKTHPKIRPLLPLVSMRQNFGLSNDEMAILLGLAIAYRSERMLRMMTVAWSDIAFKHVTAGFICRMVARNAEHYEELLSSLQDSACLIRMRLVYVLSHARYPTLTPRVLAPLMLDEAVISMLIQGRLPTRPICQALKPKELIASPELCETLAQSLSSPKTRLILRASQNAGRATLLASIAKTHHKMSCRFLNMADIFLEHTQANDGSALLKL